LVIDLDCLQLVISLRSCYLQLVRTVLWLWHSTSVFKVAYNVPVINLWVWINSPCH